MTISELLQFMTVILQTGMFVVAFCTLLLIVKKK